MNNKKKVLVTAVAVCLIAILSFSTLAWFSAEDSVDNQFMIADSADTPDEIFSVDVWELVNGDHVHKDDDGEKFEDIIPGGSYHKEPYIENTGSYDQYIRVKVTITNADAWIAALGNNYDLAKIFTGHDENLWVRYEAGVYEGDTAVGGKYTMEFYLNQKLAPDASVCLFESVDIPTQLDQYDMVFVGGGFNLTIKAEAIQTENLPITYVANEAENAYNAFDAIYD